MFVSSVKLLNGNVFSAMKTDINNRNQTDLVAEEERDRVNNLHNATALIGDNKFLISDDALKANGRVVLFDDPKTKQRVALSLDNANIQKLKEAFGGGDFYERKDGTIRLNGKAEAFVSGWFGDVAYRQGYLEADKNKDGRIDESEKSSLKTGAGSHGMVDGVTARDMSVVGYIKGGENSFPTIQEALNSIIARDKNLDGNLERIGEYQSEEEAREWTRAVAQEAVSQYGMSGGGIINDVGDGILADYFSGEWIEGYMGKMFDDNKKLTDDIKKMLEEMKKKQMEAKQKGDTQETQKSLEELQAQQQALQTLKNNGGNTNALNAEEKKAISHLTQKDVLDNKEMQDLQKQLDTESFDTISKITGVDTNLLQKVFKSSLEESTSPTKDSLDKELVSVIDSIRTQVRNGEVTLLDTMA